MELVEHMDLKSMSIMELIEFAGQLGALTSYVHLIDTLQTSLPRRVIGLGPEPNRVIRRIDGLQRNALGRKRRTVD